MADISLESVRGDLEVSRNVAAGGGLTVSGKTELGGRVVVRDWLDAPNIVGPCKGLYEDGDALLEAFPRPMSGWWALTDPEEETEAGKVLCSVWRAWKGKWTEVGGMSLEVSVPDITTSDNIEKINDSIKSLETLIETEAEDREEADKTLRSAIGAETSAREETDSNLSSEIAARKAADDELKALVEAEESARKEAIKEVDEAVDGKQDWLSYYKESSNTATIEIGGTELIISKNGAEVNAEDCEFTYNGSEVATRKDISSVQSAVETEAEDRKEADTGLEAAIAKKQDALEFYEEIDRDNADKCALMKVSEDGEFSQFAMIKDSVGVDTTGKFWYNEREVAVVDDVEAGLAKKQDALRYYKETADNDGFIVFENEGSFTAFAGAGLGGASLEYTSNDKSVDHEVVVDERGAYYDGAEIATVNDIEALSDEEIDEILEGLELVDAGSVVTSIKAEAEGLMELGAERDGGAVTLSGRTTIGCVGPEDVEDMFDNAEV